jgi:glutamine synthetase
MDVSEIIRLMDSHHIEVVKVGAADMDGVYRGKRVTRDSFLSLCQGEGIPQCDVVFGWDIQEEVIGDLPYSSWAGGFRDILMRPDLSTFAVVPWEPGAASVVCDFYTEEGEPFPVAPRQVLRRVEERATRAGLRPRMAIELEVRYFREDQESLRAKDYSGLRPLSPGVNCYSIHHASIDEDVVGEVRRLLLEYGIPVSGYNREHGAGMYEINLHHGDIVTAADQAMLYKSASREIAARRGVIPTFMAKYSDRVDGCSGHIHQSLWDAERNLFWEEGGRHHMSELMGHCVAGLLTTLPEFMLMYAPNVNSYKRLVEGTWAPTTATWGFENRTTALRVISTNAGACRVEQRVPGADVNPYLGFAACLAGGLHGIEQKLGPPPMTEGNAYAAREAPRLPSTLSEAVDAFVGSALAREFFGEGFVEHYTAMRRWEVDKYNRAVTDWERRRYFEMV